MTTQPRGDTSIENDIFGREEERRRYECVLQDILSALPEAVALAHVDLTENSFSWAHTVSPAMEEATRAETWNGLVRFVAEQTRDEDERRGVGLFESERMLESFQRGEDRQSREYRRYDERGRTQWISANVRMLRNPDNGHIEGIAYALDISADKRKEEIFRIITSRGFDLVAVIHLENRTFEAIYIGESLPTAYHKLLPEQGSICDFEAIAAESLRHMDDETRKDYMQRLSSDYIRDAIERGGGSYEFTLKEYFEDKGNDPVYRRYLHYGLSGDWDSVLVIESDVTKDVLYQQELLAQARTEAERDRAIMDSITSGIAELRLSDDGRLSVESFNLQMFRMLGYEEEDIPQRIEQAEGTPLEAAFADALLYVHPKDKARVAATFHVHGDDSEFSVDPYRMQRSDGSYSWIAEDVRASGRAPGYRTYYATFRDVTWELEAREELGLRLEKEKALRAKADAANEAKSDFLSRMSHDMRTPLNGVIGMAYLAREQHNPPRTAECLERIDTSARFLLGLINNALDMTKMESGRVELHPVPYSIEEFDDYLDAVIRPLCDEKHLHFVVEADVTRDLLPLADKNCMNQILFNLLSNAVKFTPEGGTITYSIKGRQTSGDRVMIEHRIEDTGVGMSDEFLGRLFDPFSQEDRVDASEHRGSGLGLAIVKRLVDLVGGTIEVESEQGRGTVFILQFEFDTVSSEAMEKAQEAEKAAADISFEGRHVLLCEDHPLNQEIGRTLLEEKGATVDIAADGRIGVEEFERSPVGFYDVIIMDVRMPFMDGYEATRAIRKLKRPDAETVPIIAMTADAFKDDIRKCRDAGMDAHVAKPVNPPRLFAVISRLMHRGCTPV